MKSTDDIRKYLVNIADGDIEQRNLEIIESSIKQHNEFLNAFNNECCYLCGMKLSYFNPSEKCFHWLLLPDGVKKKYLEEYLSEPIGFFQLQSYLRWVANTEEKFKNINDLKSSTSEGKLIESTIKYKQIEWSINVGKTDFKGHENSKNANFPHYHMQVLKDGLPILRFNDCHVPFSAHDLYLFEIIKHEDLVDHFYLNGEGISVIENEHDLEWVDKNMIPSESEEDATFHTQSFVEMPDGQEITIEEFEILKRESKEKGISLRKYLKEKFPGIKITSKTQPGQGVVNKKRRNKRNINRNQ